MKIKSISRRFFAFSMFGIIAAVILVEIFSLLSLRALLFDEAEYDLKDSIYLTTSNTESFVKGLVLHLFSLCENETVLSIANPTTEEYPINTNGVFDTKKQLDFQKLISSGEGALLAQRVFFLDANLYITLHTADDVLYSNYGSSVNTLERNFLPLDKIYSENPTAVSWNGMFTAPVGTFQSPGSFSSVPIDMICLSKGLTSSSFRHEGGYLSISFPVKALNQNLHNDEKNSADFERFLIEEDGTIIATTNDDLLGTNINNYVSYTFDKSSSGFYENVSTNFGNAMMTYQKLSISNWKIVELKSHSSINEKLKISSFQLLFTNISFVVALLIFMGFSTKRLTLPLQTLHKQMLSVTPETLLDPLEIPKEAGEEVLSLYNGYKTLQNRIVELLEINKQTEKAKKEREIAALQAQIKPHFLLNTLMSVRCAISNKHTEKAVEMLTQLSTFFRSSIIQKDETVSLKQELETVKTYVSIENLRSFQNYTMKTEIPQFLNYYHLPKLLLQPLVENCIKHGFINQKNGEILILATEKPDCIEISIRDNGCGFLQNPLECKANAHYGVFSVDERIKLFYGDKFGLDFQNENGTIAILRLPVQ